MTSLTIQEADHLLVSFFRDNWTATPIALEGEGYRPTRGTSYVELVTGNTLSSGQSTQGASGARRFLRDYQGRVHVYTPNYGGTKAGWTIVDQVVALLEGKTTDGLWLLDAEARYLGIDGDWTRHVVAFRYSYQEIK